MLLLPVSLAARKHPWWGVEGQSEGLRLLSALSVEDRHGT